MAANCWLLALASWSCWQTLNT